ncbi:MAG: DoxX family protein [Bacteroidales bacterium]|nr:DoxX family protein [Bacteroidales bacterium]
MLLLLGLGTRIISVPLIFTMLAAIFTVHIGNGFAAADNGFEIPLYYLLMLFVLMSYGAGKYSIDYVVRKMKG